MPTRPTASNSAAKKKELKHDADDDAAPSDPALDLATIPLETPKSAWKETFLGEEGTTRRAVSFFSVAFVVATAVRMAAFAPGIFGKYLASTLGPVERESVKWSWILAVRALDLVQGIWVWSKVDGVTRKDGVLFGALLAGISRVPLYLFEHNYFLLSTETTATLLVTDVVSLASAFALLPTLLPHSVPARAGPTAWKRIQHSPELLVNIALATGLATTLGGLITFVGERAGGMQFVKAMTSELEVPAYFAAKLSPSQMMETPTIHVPTLRSYLTPLPLPIHLSHAFLSSLLSIPLVSILPSLTPHQIALLVLSLIAPTTTLLIWDVLPMKLAGASLVGLGVAARGAVAAGVGAWVLEELRSVSVEREVFVVVDETDGEVLAAGEGDTVVKEKKKGERSRL